jgi:hypothetical protein
MTFGKTYKEWYENHKVKIGDIVVVKTPGAHMPNYKEVANRTNAHWVPGLIERSEYFDSYNQTQREFEVINFYGPTGDVAHIKLLNAELYKTRFWKRTEFFIGARGLEKIKSVEHLPKELFEI